MTITYEVKAQFDVEALSGYAEIRERFEQSFQDFVSHKKLLAAQAVLRDEIQSANIANNSDFIKAVAARVDEESIIEKRYIFLSLNSEALV